MRTGFSVGTTSPLPFRLPVQASCGAVWAWPADDPSNNVTNYRTISYSYVPANVAAGAPCEIAAFFRVWPLTLPQGGASLEDMASSTHGAARHPFLNGLTETVLEADILELKTLLATENRPAVRSVSIHPGATVLTVMSR